ncbi:hypothetical protein [Actinotalea fermentans]|uniref:Uncharacterized protein n=1 Tax=Actinotalea fermentans TaxID=43671 RepID=A0A511YZ94_9CELL|nr:hypothetical protein [Actinotalea fermentans]KGM17338.1 hypothetical protein N867_05740 [Actinotalea fermentans ATCC 43279 = JCM 9966 = DSM 3133]GEN80504.1 hypothetical protein AFE02nite_22380 [Actinotalea fermentans]
MNRTGAVPSANALGWGLGLMLVGAPGVGWLSVQTGEPFLTFVAVVLWLIGIGALITGVWSFATNHDRMAARYLDGVAPAAPSPGVAATGGRPPARTPDGDLPHRPTMPPLPGRIVATPPPEEVRIVATPAPPEDAP